MLRKVLPQANQETFAPCKITILMVTGSRAQKVPPSVKSHELEGIEVYPDPHKYVAWLLRPAYTMQYALSAFEDSR